MFDTRPALADMASQIRAGRSSEGLTLQQLASRSGVAASTIHKVESQQMVPTVSVLLKIAKGLGRRPEDLIRDDLLGGEAQSTPPGETAPVPSSEPPTPRRASVWRIALDRDRALPTVVLGKEQRATLLVENGLLHLETCNQRIEMQAGDCIEVGAGGKIASLPSQPGPAQLTLIISPPGQAENVLGAPQPQGSAPL